MSKRIYNILFHTHTISGIIISVGLYIIFFTGSFSFFRDEIVAWERNEPLVEDVRFQSMDLNKMVDTLGANTSLYGREIDITQYYQERTVGVNVGASKDTSIKGGRQFVYLNTQTLQTFSYPENYSIGEFFYRLHFFAQLNFFGRSGYILAGLVAFFFLFAIITGVLVHWKKIVSNFYLFRPRAKLKTLWTDAHTALGIIGLPYQFIFAVTGAFLIFGTIATAPPVATVIYNGDTQKMYQDLGPERQEFPLAHEKLKTKIDLNSFVDKTKAHWDNFRISSVKFKNFSDANMHVVVIGHPLYSKALTGEGKLIFHAASGKIISEKNPFDSNYFDTAIGLMDRLHFGDFGGIGLKIVYFVLGLLSCVVILSGIMIWLVARDKKFVEPKKRKFNTWMGHLFLAACLSLYPATAFTFVAVKSFVVEFDASRMANIYHIFFYSWLLLIIVFTIKRDDYFTNKYCLVLGSIIGLMIPLANGIISGNWFWKSFALHYYDIFFIDVFWLILSITTLIVACSLNQKKRFKKNQLKPIKNSRFKLSKNFSAFILGKIVFLPNFFFCFIIMVLCQI